jgi:hypothetical protein
LHFSLVCTLFSRQPHKVFTLLSRRGATEHSSTRPRFPTRHLLNVSLHIANKLGNLKKKKAFFAEVTCLSSRCLVTAVCSASSIPAYCHDITHHVAYSFLMLHVDFPWEWVHMLPVQNDRFRETGWKQWYLSRERCLNLEIWYYLKCFGTQIHSADVIRHPFRDFRRFKDIDETTMTISRNYPLSASRLRPHFCYTLCSYPPFHDDNLKILIVIKRRRFLWAATRLIGEWHLCVAFDVDPLPASF